MFHRVFVLSIVAKFLLPSQQPVPQHGRHGQRHDEAGKDGNDIGHAQRHEQFPSHSGQGKHGKKYENDNHRAKHDAVADLGTGLKHNQQLILWLCQPPIFFQASEDVFYIHNRVINQFANGDRQSTERHGVDGKPKQPEHQCRDHNRKRDRGQRNDGRAKVQQEQKQNHHHQQSTIA